MENRDAGTSVERMLAQITKAMCRIYGAHDSFWYLSHCLRTGLTSGAPTALQNRRTGLKTRHYGAKKGTMFRLLPGIFDIVPLQEQKRRAAETLRAAREINLLGGGGRAGCYFERRAG